MKLIQAMKQIKDLLRKSDDLEKKVSVHCADLSHETPKYPDQRKQVTEWLQAHADILKEVLHLRTSIARTNLATMVEIELGGVVVKKSIAEWIHRRRDLAGMEMRIWSHLGDRGLKEGTLVNSQGEKQTVTIRRYFDAATRDAKTELYRSEPMVIDGTLETVNAITDLIEA